MNGLTNIWLNIKNLRRYPDDKAMDYLRCKTGYCLLSRSKIYKNININYCIDLQHKKLQYKNLFIGGIILCKLPFWETYVPAKIQGIRSEGFSDLLELYFSSCPDSDIYLTWHSGNIIMRERSMLTYGGSRGSEEAGAFSCSAPFLMTEKVEKVEKVIETGLFDKKDSYENELLRYKLFWINSKIDSKTDISKKYINISHNISGTLSNVAVIHDEHFENILKLQCFYGANNKIQEPKKIFNLPNNVYYTGELCTESKIYLFNINKIDIK